LPSFNNQVLTVLTVTIAASAAIMLFAGAATHKADDAFSDATMDLGIVVSDLDRSIKFYTEVVGLTRTGEFFVGKDFCTDAGLTDGQDLSIQVLAPNGDVDGTNVKLMQVPGVKSKTSDESFVHSTLGFSYLTFYVSDMDAASARMKAAAVKPHGKDQVRVPLQTPVPMYLTVIADPDGNLIELVGPRPNATR
jgi:catechol 2,3-dioxygenase-like lactoylglutathione lyase family enzyme